MGIALITNNILSDSGASLSGYVPYTGATANVDLGFRTLNALTLTAQGSASEGGVLNIKKFATRTVAGIGYFSLAASDGSIAFYENTAGTSKAFNLLTSSITGNTTKNYTMPNADGTIALTSDLSGYLPLTGGTISGTLQVGGTFNQLYLGASKSSLYLDASRYVMSTISTYGIAFEIGVTPVLSIPTSGNVLINTTTDSGYKLDVNGTGRFSSSVTGSGLIAKGTGSFNVNNNIRFLRGTGTEMGYIGWSDETVNNSTWLFKSSNGNPIALSADGINQQFILTTAGNVGIGTTSPMTFGSFTNLTIASSATNNFSAIFLVNSSVSIRGSWYQNGGNQINFGTATAHPLVFDTNDVERMRITSGGVVAIGTSSNVAQTGETLLVAGDNGVNTVVVRRTGASNTNASRILFQAINASSVVQNTGIIEAGLENSSTAGYLAFFSGTTERMRLNSAGRLIVGATTDGGTGLVQIHGTARAVQLVASQGGITAGNYAIYGHDDDNGYINVVRSVFTGDFHFRFDGTTRATINRSTGVYTATSDVNKKKDIELSQIGLSEVMQLKPSLYRMKEDQSNGQKELGFIAQEVKDFIPNAYVESGDFIGLNFNPIVAALTKAVQELKAELDTLKNK